MIKTLVMLGLDEGYPVWHKSTGLAKSLHIAQWLFALCFERGPGSEFPDFAHVEEVVECRSESETIIQETRIYVLGHCLYMN